jgi:hypothetical protein
MAHPPLSSCHHLEIYHPTLPLNPDRHGPHKHGPDMWMKNLRRYASYADHCPRHEAQIRLMIAHLFSDREARGKTPPAAKRFNHILALQAYSEPSSI